MHLRQNDCFQLLICVHSTPEWNGIPFHLESSPSQSSINQYFLHASYKVPSKFFCLYLSSTPWTWSLFSIYSKISLVQAPLPLSFNNHLPDGMAFPLALLGSLTHTAVTRILLKETSGQVAFLPKTLQQLTGELRIKSKFISIKSEFVPSAEKGSDSSLLPLPFCASPSLSSSTGSTGASAHTRSLSIPQALRWAPLAGDALRPRLPVFASVSWFRSWMECHLLSGYL